MRHSFYRDKGHENWLLESQVDWSHELNLTKYVTLPLTTLRCGHSQRKNSEKFNPNPPNPGPGKKETLHPQETLHPPLPYRQ